MYFICRCSARGIVHGYHVSAGYLLFVSSLSFVGRLGPKVSARVISIAPSCVPFIVRFPETADRSGASLHIVNVVRDSQLCDYSSICQNLDICDVSERRRKTLTVYRFYVRHKKNRKKDGS